VADEGGQGREGSGVTWEEEGEQERRPAPPSPKKDHRRALAALTRNSYYGAWSSLRVLARPSLR
jgi:hypothetical protein